MFYTISFSLIVLLCILIDKYFLKLLKYKGPKIDITNKKPNLFIFGMIIFMFSPIFIFVFNATKIINYLQNLIIPNGYVLLQLDYSLELFCGTLLLPLMLSGISLFYIIFRKYDIDGYMKNNGPKKAKIANVITLDREKVESLGDNYGPRIFAIIYFISLTFFILSIGNYFSFNNNNIIVSHYFSLKETKYTYDDIKIISTETINSDTKDRYYLIIKFKDNKKYEFIVNSNHNIKSFIKNYSKDIIYDTKEAKKYFEINNFK